MPEPGIILLVLLLLLVFYSIQRFKQRGKKLPPGPLGLPVVGYLPFLNPSCPHHSLTNLSFKYGPIYSIQLGSIFTVILSDVKLVRKALALESLSGRAPLYLTHGIMKGNGSPGIGFTSTCTALSSVCLLLLMTRRFLGTCFPSMTILKNLQM